jgi:hypothetical protein
VKQADGYYAAVNGVQSGPYTMAALTQMAREGRITRSTLVWKNGMDGWQEAGQVGELKGIFAESPPPLSGVVAPPPAPQGQTPPALPQANAQAQNAGKEYKVGDRGPAAGWVFYDKGYYSNGWRYLEAAPLELEFTAKPGPLNKFRGTESGLGYGKQNTAKIVEYIRVTNIRDTCAAQMCAQLEFNGFKDWFLPSKDELNLMYRNLKYKGFGEFKDDTYWSSTNYDKNRAWYQYFDSGRQDYKNPGIGGSLTKDFVFYVRPVRQF